MKPADHRQRQQAIDPAHSCIVQAPAGSGKTGLLIQRYLRLLGLADAPEEIVAITFTRKAAAEMQGRILEALRLAHAQRHGTVAADNTDPHQQAILQLANGVLDQDKRQQWHILENPVRLQIRTIDSLCAYLSQHMPMLSQLGASPKELGQTDDRYEQAAIRTLEGLADHTPHTEAIATLLQHLDNHLPRAQRLLIDMLKKRDQWLRHIVALDTRPTLEASLQHSIEDNLGRLCEQFSEPTLAPYHDELCAILQHAAQYLDAGPPTPPLTDRPTYHTLPGSQVRDLPAWRTITEQLLTRQDQWRKTLNKKNGFPTPKKTDPEYAECAAMKQRALDLIRRLQDHETLRHLLAETRYLPSPTYSDYEWEVLRALCTCLRLAEAHLRLCFAEQRQIDYTGMAQAAIQALGEEDAPTDLLLYLDHQIRHLLVDEFQDISISQQTLLLRLCAGWQAGDGHSLFLVGDPMQSIYRFREAEVAIFMQTFSQARFGQIPLTCLQLSVNFRTVHGIIHWINHCFSTLLPKQDTISIGAVAYSPAKAVHGDTIHPTVHHHPTFDTSGQTEAQTAIKIIHSIREQTQTASIAILARQRSHLQRLIPLLHHHNILFQAVEIEELGQQSVIQDLLVLTRAYSHPADRTAWLALLRAPWCGLSLADLYQLTGDDPHRTIWELINRPDRQQRLDQAAQHRLNRVIKCLDDALAHRQRHSLQRSIEILWMSLGGPATLTTTTDLENAAAFFEILETVDRIGHGQIGQQLEDKIQQIYAAPCHDNSLQVMTIHKSKGLEFDHVIIIGLGHTQKKSQDELLRWALRTSPRYGDELLLAINRKSGTKAARTYDYIAHITRQKEYNEAIRLLYVAMTRSRASLHLLTHAQHHQDKQGEWRCTAAPGSPLSHLWPILKKDLEQATPATTTHNAQPSKKTYYRLSGQWRPPPLPRAITTWHAQRIAQPHDTPPPSIEYEWAGTSIRCIGIVVHRILQQIAEQGRDHWNLDRILENRARFSAMLQQQGITRGRELTQACQQVILALKNSLEDERGRWILDPAHHVQKNEYALTGTYQGGLINIVVDRTFVDGHGIRWIIDYKLSQHQSPDEAKFMDQEQGRYYAQLRKYSQLLKGMGREPVRAGLYFPLLRGWREVSCD